MKDNVETKVKELVTDFKLEEALDLLIVQAQTQNQRKQNALLVLKGKLALLEEQNLSGILDPSDVARQKAAIAHQILDIADGSPLDRDISTPMPEEPRISVQKTVSIPSSGGGFAKYLLLAGLLVAAVVASIFISKNMGEKNTTEAVDTTPQPPSQDTATPTSPAPGGGVKLMNFPSLKQDYKFLDFVLSFAWADAEWISDTEIRLKIRYYLTCKSNLGICYRPSVRLYADGKLLAPTDQSNTAGWVAHEDTVSDDINFVLPSDAKTFEIEFSRDHSTWRRPFQIVIGH